MDRVHVERQTMHAPPTRGPLHTETWHVSAQSCHSTFSQMRACTICRFHARRKVHPKPLEITRKAVCVVPKASSMGLPYGPSMYACKLKILQGLPLDAR